MSRSVDAFIIFACIRAFLFGEIEVLSQSCTHPLFRRAAQVPYHGFTSFSFNIFLEVDSKSAAGGARDQPC